MTLGIRQNNGFVPFRFSRLLGLLTTDLATSGTALSTNLVDHQIDCKNVQYGKCFANVGKLPSYNTDTKSLNILPDRVQDYFPQVYNDSEIGRDTVYFGKTSFSIVNGSLYEASKSCLCPATTIPLITGYETIRYFSGMFFASKSKLTDIYTYNELGMVQVGTIEDKS